MSKSKKGRLKKPGEKEWMSESEKARSTERKGGKISIGYGSQNDFCFWRMDVTMTKRSEKPTHVVAAEAKEKHKRKIKSRNESNQKNSILGSIETFHKVSLSSLSCKLIFLVTYKSRTSEHGMTSLILSKVISSISSEFYCSCHFW